MKRRDFLKYTVPPTAATAMLGNIPVRAIGMESPLIRALMESPNDTDHVLVLVQMNGGNDGLNMVIPIDNYSSYQSARSNVARDQIMDSDLNVTCTLTIAMLQRKSGGFCASSAMSA